MSGLNNFVNPPIPTPVVCEKIPDEGHNRRGAFAAMKDLSEKFANRGLYTEQVWAFLKSENGVETRSQLTEKQWAIIAGRLQAMRLDEGLLDAFIDGIPDKHFRFYVLATDPTVPVGRPRVGLQEMHKPEVWGDFQQLANDLQTELKVWQGKTTVFYTPRPVAPEPESEPEPTPAPVGAVSNRSESPNARGEILSPWGEVVEVIS